MQERGTWKRLEHWPAGEWQHTAWALAGYKLVMTEVRQENRKALPVRRQGKGWCDEEEAYTANSADKPGMATSPTPNTEQCSHR